MIPTHVGLLEDRIYRNFNLCPHCTSRGEQSLLIRLQEGIPMISRSDGYSFHLFLADQPKAYPAERGVGRTTQVSICFWHQNEKNGVRSIDTNRTSIVILTADLRNRPGLYRLTERVADELAAVLQLGHSLEPVYRYEEAGLLPSAF